MNIIGNIDIIGDTHGSNRPISRWAELGDTENLIHVGDFGVGFKGSMPKISQLAQELNDFSKNVYVIRGNHDDPSFFDGRMYGGYHGGIHFLRDGTIADWNGEKILFNGGAISIDRAQRINEIDIWEDEGFKPFKKIETEIDYLVTHSSFPEVTSFPIKGEMVVTFAKYDQDLISDLEKESQSIKNWVDSLIENQEKKIKTWHYGHFHKSHQSNYNGIKCTCLNIEEIRPFDEDFAKRFY